MKFGTIELISKVFMENKEIWDDEVYQFFFRAIDALASEYCTNSHTRIHKKRTPFPFSLHAVFFF